MSIVLEKAGFDLIKLNPVPPFGMHVRYLHLRSCENLRLLMESLATVLPVQYNSLGVTSRHQWYCQVLWTAIVASDLTRCDAMHVPLNFKGGVGFVSPVRFGVLLKQTPSRVSSQVPPRSGFLSYKYQSDSGYPRNTMRHSS